MGGRQGARHRRHRTQAAPTRGGRAGRQAALWASNAAACSTHLGEHFGQDVLDVGGVDLVDQTVDALTQRVPGHALVLQMSEAWQPGAEHGGQVHGAASAEGRGTCCLLAAPIVQPKVQAQHGRMCDVCQLHLSFPCLHRAPRHPRDPCRTCADSLSAASAINCASLKGGMYTPPAGPAASGLRSRGSGSGAGTGGSPPRRAAPFSPRGCERRRRALRPRLRLRLGDRRRRASQPRLRLRLGERRRRSSRERLRERLRLGLRERLPLEPLHMGREEGGLQQERQAARSLHRRHPVRRSTAAAATRPHLLLLVLRLSSLRILLRLRPLESSLQERDSGGRGLGGGGQGARQGTHQHTAPRHGSPTATRFAPHSWLALGRPTISVPRACRPPAGASRGWRCATATLMASACP